MLDVITVCVTPFQQNARILHCKDTNSIVIVDPGGDIPDIVNAIPKGVVIEAIWITHSHIDHVSGVAELLSYIESHYPNQQPPNVIAHPDDSINRDALPMQSQMMQFPYSGDFNVTDTVKHHDTVKVGEYAFQVLHTPGHAIGHISLFCNTTNNTFQQPLLIAGDALFYQSIGRTDLPGGNHEQLLNSIRDHLFTLPSETVVCSGHGPNTTIEYEVLHNPFLK
jgi:hydroxyacylglutathione hydrolase